ncbi:MAG: hypothetical protein ACLUIQ_01025 [Dialister invisus]
MSIARVFLKNPLLLSLMRPHHP